MTEKDLLKELGNIDPEFIQQAEPEITGEGTKKKQKKALSFPKKILALAACFALIIGAMSLVGFDKVYSAMQNLFSFIPGVGIEIAQADSTVYVCTPINGKINFGETQAQILRASYSKGELSASVLVNRVLSTDDVKVYINGKEYKKGEAEMPVYSLAVALDSSLLEFILETALPKESDVFELEIAGFDSKLSFSMKPCETYESLQEIGPTQTKNGITLTATATRIDNELVVWCYETRSPEATRDTLASIGTPSNGANPVVQYLETDKGDIYDTHGGWQLFGRSVYELSGDESTAVLHVPYLAMLRDENGKFNVALPENEGITKTDCTAQTSLGSIKITEIQRSPSEFNPGKDTVLLKFGYENIFGNMKIYGLTYMQNGSNNGAVRYGQDGTTEYMEFEVSKDQKSLNISFDGIYFYLTDEYTFNLDIK